MILDQTAVMSRAVDYLRHTGSDDSDSDPLAPIAGIIFRPTGNIGMLYIEVLLEDRKLR